MNIFILVLVVAVAGAVYSGYILVKVKSLSEGTVQMQEIAKKCAELQKDFEESLKKHKLGDVISDLYREIETEEAE